MRGARPERALDAIVRRTLHPDAGGRVCVACSGGPDSVSLASLVDRIAREDDYGVVLAHVDHGRRASALQDEAVVLSVGARLGRPVAIARPAISADDEASLRKGRYAALYALAIEHACTIVVTAHSAEDQTETVLLALFRGTGLDGLAGMPQRRPLGPGVDLVRPLLRVSRAELATELRRSALPYVLDPTNADTRYRRNAIRSHLATLRSDFPHLDRAVARCAAIVRDELDRTPEAARRRVLRERLRSAGKLRDVTLDEIETLLASEGPG
jgi:tRNA(Ile)-lysidine synthase